jgi:hypothetical protein
LQYGASQTGTNEEIERYVRDLQTRKVEKANKYRMAPAPDPG